MPKSKGNKSRRKARNTARLARKAPGAVRNAGILSDFAGITISPESAADGDCSNGHPEQAMDLMLYGISPGRCPRCGKTPQFDDFSQNSDSNLPGYEPDEDDLDDLDDEPYTLEEAMADANPYAPDTLRPAVYRQPPDALF